MKRYKRIIEQFKKKINNDNKFLDLINELESLKFQDIKNIDLFKKYVDPHFEMVKNYPFFSVFLGYQYFENNLVYYFVDFNEKRIYSIVQQDTKIQYKKYIRLLKYKNIKNIKT